MLQIRQKAGITTITECIYWYIDIVLIIHVLMLTLSFISNKLYVYSESQING